MNDDYRQPAEQPMFEPVEPLANALRTGAAALPVGTLTASVLFDVLALFAESPVHAATYNRRAADLLKFGLGGALAAFAIEFLDVSQLPATTPPGRTATRKLAIDGAVVALYLLELAAREKELAGVRPSGAFESVPLALSLVALTLLGISQRLG